MNTWNENYQWHFDYVRLAWDTTFNFDKQKTLNLDKSKICLIDVDRIIDQRDFAAVERCIPTVVQYTLEPEQASVLDENFVKIFRMGQLAVQYLLFCKKYLDNTVVLLKSELSKFKEENKELKVFNDELKDHVSVLVRKMKIQKNQGSASIHRCEKCMKLFSSEQFLTAHMKRRHPSSDNDDSTVSSEANRLQSEIKMLKERLNSTERLIQQEQKPSNESIQLKDKESEVRLMELQQKFEMWKVQVEGELKIIQTQKNAEEKYEKWFENVFEKLKETMVSSSKSTEVKEVDTTLEYIHTNDVVVARQDSVTQTENFIPIETQGKITPVKTLPPKIEETMEGANLEEDKKSFDTDVLPVIKKEITRFEEVVNSKVTDSFQKIENQLDSFWTKLNQIEEISKTPIHVASVPDQIGLDKDTQSEIATVDSKVTQSQSIQGEDKDTQYQPVVKPRTKYQQKPHESDHKETVLRVEVNQKAVNSLQMIPKEESEDTSSDENIYEIRDERKSKMKSVGILRGKHGNYEGERSPQRHDKKDLSVNIITSKPLNIPESRKHGKDFVKGDTHKRARSLSPKKNKGGSSLHSRGATLKKILSDVNASKTNSIISKRRNDTLDLESESDDSSESSESELTPKAIKQDFSRGSPKRQMHRKQLNRLPVHTKKARNKSPPVEHQSPEKVKIAQIEFIKESLMESIEARLKMMGVSPEWKTLPQRSFKKAMEIVNHQAALSEKNISNYQHIRKHILQKVTKLLNKRGVSQHVKISKHHRTPEKKSIQARKPREEEKLHQSGERARGSPSPKHEVSRSPKCEPKLLNMYDSDTPEDTEVLHHQRETPVAQPRVVNAKHIRGYSDVIRELKLKSSEVFSSGDSSSEDQSPRNKNPEIATERMHGGTVAQEKIRSHVRDIPDEGNHTKGVLKSYPSVGSLTKKKVLFDLDSESNNKATAHHMKDGGSTTSLGSSVFDGTPRAFVGSNGDTMRKTEEKELEDLSDFDF